MTDFRYTHSAEPTSSAVDGVWYNENERTLALNLHDTVYVYSGVPKNRYEELLTADSAGRYYRDVIRSNYGPAQLLGSTNVVRFVQLVVANSFGFVTVGDARVANSYTPTPQLSLAAEPVVDNAAKGLHTVYFTRGSDTTERKFDTNAANVDEALEALLELDNMLGLTFTPKGVYVHLV